MPQQLPTDVRRKILRTEHDRVPEGATFPQSTLAVAREGWVSALSDCNLSHLDERLGSALAEVESATEARSLHNAASALVSLALDVHRNMWSLAALQPAERGEPKQIGRLVVSCSKLATAGDDEHARAELSQLRKALQRLKENLGAVFEDPCEAAFGVPYESLRDSHGTFTPARLFASYYGRNEELAERVADVLAPITDTPPPLPAAIQAAEGLVITPRPHISLRVARDVTALVARQLHADPLGLAQPMRELKHRVERSATSHKGIIRTTRALEQASTDSERAELSLDLYRRMVEGQLRHCAWTLLRAHGYSSDRVPEVGNLREQLLATGSPLLRDAAEAILPAARNAAAHEDFEWDGTNEVVRVGEAEVTIAELEDGTERAYAFMCGAEAAWACARATWPQFAALIDAADPEQGFNAFNTRSALTFFGTNGLQARSWSYERNVFEVSIDSLPYHLINPCFQAAVWASLCLPDASRVRVLLPEHPQPAADLSREALHATYLVWMQARAGFSVMPVSTFLPANVEARLQVELPDKAARAGAWLALNDVVDAYEEALGGSDPKERRAAELMLRLDLVRSALSATMAILPPESVAPLREALDLVQPAATRISPITRGYANGPSATIQGRIEQLRAGWPVPAVLPTIDARPLDLMESEDQSLQIDSHAAVDNSSQ